MQSRLNSPRIIGDTLAMRALRRRIRRLAEAPHPVLVQGETGVGKELAAQALHAHSGRTGRFIAVNCATLRPELMAAELFGSKAGGFTGAVDRDGLCVQASGGTLFLDEIGELPLPAQAMLLRVLSLGVVRPVGGSRDRTVDFRLVCATHRDLSKMVAAGGFRRDLLHRIDTLPLDVPPLRDRLADVALLAEHFLGADAHHLAPSAIERLKQHAWPGNIRELRNVLLRAKIDADGIIEARHLDIRAPHRPARPSGALVCLPLKVQMGQVVARTVQAYHGNIRAAARALDISPTTAYRYLDLASGSAAGP